MSAWEAATTPGDDTDPAYLERATGYLLADIAEAEARLARLTARRDEVVRARLALGQSGATVAKAFSLSRERVYQIRDRRR